MMGKVAVFVVAGVAWLAACGALERHRMGERGRRWVLKNRTYAQIADRLEGKYLELLSVSNQ